MKFIISIGQVFSARIDAKKMGQLEFVFYKRVCKQEISLAEAQHEMAKNWIEAWKRYVPSHKYYRIRRVD
jgi:hypothetical protein